MASLRWRIIILLAWLMLFFNIERLDLGSHNTIDIASGAYVIAIAVAVAGMLPFFQQRSVVFLIVPTFAAYAIVMALDPKRQLIGGLHTYVTFTTLFLLSVTLFLAYRVGQALEEFVHAVEDITFSNKGEHLRTLSEADDLVQLEMLSSRRHQRPLSLVLMQADASSLSMVMHRLVQDVQRSMMQRYVLVTVARVLSKYMRRTDMIIEGNKLGRFILLAPETTAAEAEALGIRMSRLAQDKLGVQAKFSVATFPEQALTFEDLLNIAEHQLREQRATLNEPDVEPEEVVTERAELTAREVGAVPPSEHATYTAMD
jgi:GGDEF domain-containing protein